MSVLEKRKHFLLIQSLCLFISLLLIRVSRISSAFIEHGFKINSLNDILFIFFSFFTDIIFSLVLYLFFRIIFRSIKTKKALNVVSIIFVSLCYIILSYSIIDLFYFKYIGRSLTLKIIITESSKLSNFWDSLVKNFSFYNYFSFITGMILIGPGSIIINHFLYQKKSLLNKRRAILRTDFIILLILIFFLLINITFLKVDKTLYKGIKSSSVITFINSCINTVFGHDKDINKQLSSNLKLSKLDRNSRLFSLTDSDRKTQQLINEKLSTIENRNFNVIIYLAESTWSGRLKTYNPKAKNSMPNLHSMSSKSLIFKNMYSSSVRSMNSLVSILTGLGGYPGFAVLTDVNPQIKTPSLSQILHKKGYATGLLHAGSFSFYKKLKFLENRDFELLKDVNYLKKKYPDEWKFSWGIDDKVMVKEGLSWIDKQIKNDKNFFLTLVPIIPHHPYIIPDHAPKFIKDPKRSYHKYLNSLYYVDTIFKELHDQLKSRNLLENTIIVYLADHGEAFSIYHTGNWGHSGKIYEENIKVPALIFNPLLFDRQFIFDSVVNTSDIFATLIELLDLENPIGSQGISFLDMETSQMAFFGTGNYDTLLGLRDGPYKVIYNYNKNTIQLYNVAKTRVEKIDLTETEPETATSYKNILNDYFAFQTGYFEDFNTAITKIKATETSTKTISLLKLEPVFSVQNKYSIRKNSTSKNNEIMICGKKYKTGLGVYADSIIYYDISGLNAKKLTGQTGKVDLNFENTDIKNARVKTIDPKNVQHFLEMIIKVDGKTLFTTGKITNNQIPIPFDIDVRNAKTIEMLVLNAGDGNIDDNAVWLDPVLVVK